MRQDVYNDDVLLELILKNQSKRLKKEAIKLDRRIRLLKELEGLDLSEFRPDVHENYASRIYGLKNEIKELKDTLIEYLN